MSARVISPTSDRPGVDRPLDRRIVLSGAWISTLFVFAYVDILGFWRADVINGALAGEIPGPGFTINQTFLVLTTLYILLPSLMIVATLVLPRRVTRPLTIGLAGLYALTIMAAMTDESWVYFHLGSVVELVLLAAIARIAWRWA